MSHPDGDVPLLPAQRPPLHYHPDTATVLAAQVCDLIAQPRHEWYVALLLDEDGAVLDWHVLYDGRQHEDVWPCLPYVDLGALLDHAQACGAVEAAMIRYHRAIWTGPAEGAGERFRWLYTTLEAGGLDLVDHLSIDVRGTITQFGHYGVEAGGVEGPRRRRALEVPMAAVLGIISESSLAWF